MAAAFPAPQQAVYAASKTFLLNFGQALSQEWAGTGVTCTTVLPGLTRTNYFARTGLVAGNAPTGIWAGIVATSETIPAQIDPWHDSRPVRAARTRSRWRIWVTPE
jgi:short-subunit dehydrogenase